MVATSGARLLRPDAMQELMQTLLPLATVVTPNVPEAEILCGHSIADVDQLTQAGGPRDTLAARGVGIGSVPIRVIYGDEKSKINPIKDTIRFFRMLQHCRKGRA
jgi:sugar/nucleoside kinase (ribokinase family)